MDGESGVDQKCPGVKLVMVRKVGNWLCPGVTLGVVVKLGG